MSENGMYCLLSSISPLLGTLLIWTVAERGDERLLRLRFHTSQQHSTFLLIRGVAAASVVGAAGHV